MDQYRVDGAAKVLDIVACSQTTSPLQIRSYRRHAQGIVKGHPLIFLSDPLRLYHLAGGFVLPSTELSNVANRSSVQPKSRTFLKIHR